MVAGDPVLCLITYMFGLNFLRRIFVLLIFFSPIFCLHLGIWTFFFSHTNVSVVFVWYKIPLRVFHRGQFQSLFRTWSWECNLKEDDQSCCRAPQNGTIPRRSQPCCRAPSQHRYHHVEEVSLAEELLLDTEKAPPLIVADGGLRKGPRLFSLLMSTNSSKERGNRAQPTNPLFL